MFKNLTIARIIIIMNFHLYKLHCGNLFPSIFVNVDVVTIESGEVYSVPYGSFTTIRLIAVWDN